MIKDYCRWPFITIIIASTLAANMGGLNSVYSLTPPPPSVKPDIILPHMTLEESIELLNYISKGAAIILATGYMDRGRRSTIVSSLVAIVVGDVLTILPYTWAWIVGRLITNTAVGVISITNPVYLMETVVFTARGIVMLTYLLLPHAIGVILGNVLIMVDGRWIIFVRVEVVFSVACLYFMLISNESPRILIQQGRLEPNAGKSNAAVACVRRICPDSKADIEVRSMEIGINEEVEEKGANKNPFRKVCNMWREADTRRALLTWVLCVSLPQLTGANAVKFFTATLLKNMGISPELNGIYGSMVDFCLKLAGWLYGGYLLTIRKRSRVDALVGSFGGAMLSFFFSGLFSLVGANLWFLYASMASSLAFFYAGFGVAVSIAEEMCPLCYRGIVASIIFILSFACGQIVARLSEITGRISNLTPVFIILFFWNGFLRWTVRQNVPNLQSMPLEVAWTTLKNLGRPRPLHSFDGNNESTRGSPALTEEETEDDSSICN